MSLRALVLIVLLDILVPYVNCASINSHYYADTNNQTVLLALKGRSETIDAGNTHLFLTRLQQQLSNRSLSGQYNIVNAGLSYNDTEDGLLSQYTSMDYQLLKLCDYLKNPVTLNQLYSAHRIILVGFSQGGLLMRAFLWSECLDSAIMSKIYKLITFGSPHSGVFETPDCSQFNTQYDVLMSGCEILVGLETLTNMGPALFDTIMYNPLATTLFSPASYWNDPTNIGSNTTFLAKISNEIVLSAIFQKTCAPMTVKYLSKYLKDGGLYLVAFGNDQTVLPRVSALFGLWDHRAKNEVPFTETELYRNDCIGLRELNENGLVKSHIIPNESHMSIPTDFIDTFIEYIQEKYEFNEIL